MTPIIAWVPSEVQLLILLIIGLALFGRRLPEIGRSLGKGIVEFKKGLKGMEDEVEAGGSLSSPAPRQEQAAEPPRPPQRLTASTPKFEDPAPKFAEPTPKFQEAPPNVPAPPQS